MLPLWRRPKKSNTMKIAAYGSAAAWADMLGRQDIKNLLVQTLGEEKKADRMLTELAKTNVNQRANAGHAEQRIAAYKGDRRIDDRNGPLTPALSPSEGEREKHRHFAGVGHVTDSSVSGFSRQERQVLFSRGAPNQFEKLDGRKN